MEVLLLLVLGLAGVVVILAMRQPDTFRVMRMRYIVASPAEVFPFLNSPRAASQWSPFEKDPQMKKIYSGPEAGVGAKMTWDGNRQTGAGDIEIIESVPDQRVVLRLNMQRPMRASNLVTYELEAVDGGTEITWIMSGDQPFLGKLINLVINCDRMVGGEFEKGLATLKSLVEKRAS